MAVVKVLKETTGWNVGDHIEVFGVQLDGMVAEGSVEVLVPDVKEEEKVEVKEVVVEDKSKKGRPKGVK